MARSSEYTEAVGNVICERIALGESLRAICRDNKMPAMSTVFKWLVDFPAFSDQYARAREEQADALFDDIVAIADEATTEDVQVARLRVDARKWAASKLKPKKYGDKQILSGDKENPVYTVSKIVLEGVRADRSD